MDNNGCASVVNERGKASIGIDVGGTKTRLALFDASFEVIEERKFASHPEKGGVRAYTQTLKKEVGSCSPVLALKGSRCRRWAWAARVTST